MTDIDRLDQRLSAVERVVVDGDVTLEELSELTALSEEVSELERRIEEQERRIADLEASVQSIEGYVGNVQSINDDVERQAASAVATVDRLERRLDKLEVEINDLQGGLLEEESPEKDDESDDEGTDEEGDDSTDDEVFQFGTGTDPTPEESVAELVEETTESEPIVDDGVDREISSANQSAVASAIDGESDHGTSVDGEAEDEESLLDSLRDRLS
ncbi:DUF7310 family coiled-coil domain-containing protein [Halopiger goleimassiliensis]|uniref:DUF7310 family coiled-coil domain-containing protein n=1 Tax=Halopiger goleimassiliensis TaxID=1293048 RepID=UPI0006775FA5|nr:hypothetical protein [Halopiger goleimassiliensis]